MTAVAEENAPTPADLLVAYLEHVADLRISDWSKTERRRGAGLLLERHPDLEAWMARPTLARLADLHRADAWPFVVWCLVQGHLHADVELLLAKPGGVELSSVWEAAHPDDLRRAMLAGHELGWSPNWVRQVARHTLPVVCVWAARTLDQLADDDLVGFAEAVEAAVHLTESARYRACTRLYGVWQICYQLHLTARPPRRRNATARTPAGMAERISQPLIRREVVRYAETVGTVLRPASVYARVKAICVFCDWLADRHPEVHRLDELERTVHIEPYLCWARTRPWRGANGQGRTISLTQFHHDLVDLRVFFEDIAGWGWACQPRSRLLFLADLPRLPEPMPPALPPPKDQALMAAVAMLEDTFVRTGLTLLRATGLRVGELLDLELDCVVSFGNHGSWLKVPLGKLGTERMVPLEAPTLAVLDAWMAARGQQRALPHPRLGRTAHFLFMERGRRPTEWRLRRGLNQAAAAAGLTQPDGSSLHLTLHQLRHTFGTSLINAGISLPALMALMGHVSPEMTLRYARLASPTVRMAYEAAMGKVQARTALVIPAGRTTAIPSRVDWLRSEMLKTRVAHGYCARELVAGACPYANICEQCDNFIPAAEFASALEDQLTDVLALKADASQRGWDSEAARHGRVIDSLKEHLRRVSSVAPEEAPA